MENETVTNAPIEADEPRTAVMKLDNPLIVAMAPVVARASLGAIAAFDRRMADIARRADPAEIILAQLRLAWWREEIELLAVDRLRPDPVLAAIAGMSGQPDIIHWRALIDAWEGLMLADPFDLAAARSFASRRGGAIFSLAHGAFGSAAERLDDTSGTAWALTDLALNLSDAAMVRQIFAAICKLAPNRENPPRPLYALDRWARRVARNGGRFTPWRDQAMLLRIGMIGR